MVGMVAALCRTYKHVPVTLCMRIGVENKRTVQSKAKCKAKRTRSIFLSIQTCFTGEHISIVWIRYIDRFFHMFGALFALEPLAFFYRLFVVAGDFSPVFLASCKPSLAFAPNQIPATHLKKNMRNLYTLNRITCMWLLMLLLLLLQCVSFVSFYRLHSTERVFHMQHCIFVRSKDYFKGLCDWIKTVFRFLTLFSTRFIVIRWFWCLWLHFFFSSLLSSSVRCMHTFVGQLQQWRRLWRQQRQKQR